jgi:hypothetical protein
MSETEVADVFGIELAPNVKRCCQEQNHCRAKSPVGCPQILAPSRIETSESQVISDADVASRIDISGRSLAGREEFRRALQTAMPKLLTNGQKTPKEQMLEILEGISAKTWRKDTKHLRELVASL